MRNFASFGILASTHIQDDEKMQIWRVSERLLFRGTD